MVTVNIGFLDAYVIASMALIVFLFSRTVLLARKNRSLKQDLIIRTDEYYELFEAYSKTLPPF